MTDHSGPSVRIRFTFELVNERRGLTQPFESLRGSEPIESGVTVEILRLALGKRTLEFFGRLDFSLSIFHFDPAILQFLNVDQILVPQRSNGAFCLKKLTYSHNLNRPLFYHDFSDAAT